MSRIRAARAIISRPGRSFATLMFPHVYRLADGLMHPGEVPGLGVHIDEDLAASYSFGRAYLQVNRLEDRTMFHW